jgi:hypothetical protein
VGRDGSSTLLGAYEHPTRVALAQGTCESVMSDSRTDLPLEAAMFACAQVKAERLEHEFEELAKFEKMVDYRCRGVERAQRPSTLRGACGMSAAAVIEKMVKQSGKQQAGAHAHAQNFPRPLLPAGAFTTRPVSKNEFSKNDTAMKAYWKEWNNLEAKGVWDWSTLCEWSDCQAVQRSKVAAATKAGVLLDADDLEVHLGYLFGFMVEKGAEFPEGDVRRKWKYRVVFQGNMVVDQDWQAACFEQLASTPANLESSRYADLYALFPGHSVEARDVQQAYLQAELRGPPTYVVLPKELWTPAMHKMKCPVVRLNRALYGHKNSGVFWQEYCEKQCKNAGFEQFSECWPGCYWHAVDRLLLIVYVDDIKMSGPKDKMEEAWKNLSKGLCWKHPRVTTSPGIPSLALSTRSMTGRSTAS